MIDSVHVVIITNRSKGLYQRLSKILLPSKKYSTAYAKTILNYTKKDITTSKMFVKRMLVANPAKLKETAQELNIC